MSEIITRNALLEVVDAWIAQGKTAVGPTLVKSDLCLYAPLASAKGLVLDGVVHPANSIKECFFPRHEKIYTYRFKGHQIELADADPPQTAQLIVGARPCDAASIATLDQVFNW